MKLLAVPILFSLLSALPSPTYAGAQPVQQDWATPLDREAATLGKAAWHPMLAYDVAMHRASTHPATPPFQYPWEDTGTGYGYGPGFGHWDLVHEILDVLPTAPEHAREQLLNDIHLQLPSGFLPGLYWMRTRSTTTDSAVADVASVKFSPTQTHPPVWVVAADDYLQQSARTPSGLDKALAAQFLNALTRQVEWFEQNRRALPDGFLYSDITTNQWESGVDEGIRFDGTGPGHKPTSTACVDATAHVYQMYMYGAKWSRLLGLPSNSFEAKAAHLRTFMQTTLWSERDGFFYDSWVLERAPDGPRSTWQATPATGRPHPFEGLWPMIVGAATPQQASRVIDEWLMRRDRFFTVHPVATVAQSDPRFELRMWRGPAWNSMTYWAARGAARYGRRPQARALLEAALDDTAKQFTRTGTIWEFYNPSGGPPEQLTRKPQTKRNLPFSDYLGHNPLLAMTRLWTQLAQSQAASTGQPSTPAHNKPGGSYSSGTPFDTLNSCRSPSSFPTTSLSIQTPHARPSKPSPLRVTGPVRSLPIRPASCSALKLAMSLDGFLKTHEVWDHAYGLEDLDKDVIAFQSH